jgi:FHS family L-fucose permease-like MFS transporter
MNQQTKWSQFGVLITVFFFWGFVAASNSIFIPFCKKFFQLDQIQSQLIGSAFYGAYFYGSLILYLISTFSGTDVLNKIGYKKGIIYGLLISVVGAIALAMISGSGNATFAMVLVSFFIFALGF